MLLCTPGVPFVTPNKNLLQTVVSEVSGRFLSERSLAYRVAVPTSCQIVANLTAYKRVAVELSFNSFHYGVPAPLWRSGHCGTLDYRLEFSAPSQGDKGSS